MNALEIAKKAAEERNKKDLEDRRRVDEERVFNEEMKKKLEQHIRKTFEAFAGAGFIYDGRQLLHNGEEIAEAKVRWHSWDTGSDECPVNQSGYVITWRVLDYAQRLCDESWKESIVPESFDRDFGTIMAKYL